jgi:hypothetical protein
MGLNSGLKGLKSVVLPTAKTEVFLLHKLSDNVSTADWKFDIHIACCRRTVLYLVKLSTRIRGPGRVLGIATGDGLDGPGIESRCGARFSDLSRPDLGPTQPPVQWVPGVSRR